MAMVEEFEKDNQIDKRVTVFELTIKDGGHAFIVDGVVQNRELRDRFIDYCNRKLFKSVIGNITIVDDSDVQIKGLIRVSVANLHKEPSLSSPLVTQALMGTMVTVIKTNGDWSYIQLPDGYLGWISETVVFLTDETHRMWNSLSKVIVTDLCSWIYSSVEMGATVGDAVIGNIFPISEEFDKFYKVKYPDNRTGFIKKGSVQILKSWLATRNATEQSIIETAKRLTGIPYLWGGTSSKAVDCSGFSWLVYFLNGLLLPRDADQQALIGKEIIRDSEFTNVVPGDLLFFGRRVGSMAENEDCLEDVKIPITHVGISLGGKRYMQASGDVHWSSFDPADSDFDKRRSESLLKIRRIIGLDTAHGIRKLNQMTGLKE